MRFNSSEVFVVFPRMAILQTAGFAQAWINSDSVVRNRSPLCVRSGLMFGKRVEYSIIF